MMPNMKHIRQMGTPALDDRIYIENSAYARVHEEDYAKQRAFVFMGHTECCEGCYTTIVEAAIPVRELEFSQNVPCWNTHVWSNVFREIKRSYENSIIVGWAYDCKGFSPRMTPALEAVHCEQFGGAHQLLLLMDTLEGEEYFFQNRGNRLQQKAGFYIYYARELHRVCPAEITVEVPLRESAEKISAKEPERTKSNGRKYSFAVVAAVAVLVVMLGLNAVYGNISLSQIGQALQTMGKKTQWLVGTEEAMTESATEVIELIPIEEAPVEKIDEEKTSEEESETTQEDTQTVSRTKSYTVKRGDTLTEISRSLYGSTARVDEISELNNLENSDEIHEGQKLLLP